MITTSTITVQAELPEGVHVSTREYQLSHGHPGNVYGSWAFSCEGTPDGELPDGLDSDGILWLKGTLTDVLGQLPEGDWQMLP